MVPIVKSMGEEEKKGNRNRKCVESGAEIRATIIHDSVGMWLLKKVTN